MRFRSLVFKPGYGSHVPVGYNFCEVKLNTVYGVVDMNSTAVPHLLLANTTLESWAGEWALKEDENDNNIQDRILNECVLIDVELTVVSPNVI